MGVLTSRHLEPESHLLAEEMRAGTNRLRIADRLEARPTIESGRRRVSARDAQSHAEDAYGSCPCDDGTHEQPS